MYGSFYGFIITNDIVNLEIVISLLKQLLVQGKVALVRFHTTYYYTDSELYYNNLVFNVLML